MPRPHKSVPLYLISRLLRLSLLFLTLTLPSFALAEDVFEDFEDPLVGWTVYRVDRSSYAVINGSYGLRTTYSSGGYIQRSMTLTSSTSLSWLIYRPGVNYPTVAFSGGPTPVCSALAGESFTFRCRVTVPPGSYTFRWTMTFTSSGMFHVDFNRLDDIRITDTSEDMDDDTVPDATDNCPSTANIDQWNNDADLQGDICDGDDDNDTVVDVSDNCSLNANADQLNTDGDTQGNVCDNDDDNDAYYDWDDKFPLNVAASSDTDVDGFPGSWNAACDTTCQVNSGLVLDNCPTNSNVDQINTDGDGQGNVCDSDDDNDGVPDVNDAFPLNAAESFDTDLDGTGNNADSDDDNDGLPDVMDPLPLQSKFNLNAPYKGSQLKDQSAVQ